MYKYILVLAAIILTVITIGFLVALGCLIWSLFGD